MTTNINEAAAALGRKGGAAKTEAKQAASRANGKKGGRPVDPLKVGRRLRVIRSYRGGASVYECEVIERDGNRVTLRATNANEEIVIDWQ